MRSVHEMHYGVSQARVKHVAQSSRHPVTYVQPLPSLSETSRTYGEWYIVFREIEVTYKQRSGENICEQLCCLFQDDFEKAEVGDKQQGKNHMTVRSASFQSCAYTRVVMRQKCSTFIQFSYSFCVCMQFCAFWYVDSKDYYKREDVNSEAISLERQVVEGSK